MGEAADIISQHPIALQLRIMQVLNQIAVEKNSTIIFPAPLMNSISDISNFLKSENRKLKNPKRKTKKYSTPIFFYIKKKFDYNFNLYLLFF